jgi:hypothetical protein
MDERGKAKGVWYRKRCARNGRIEDGYDAWLTRLMQRACEVGAVIYLEDIYLAEKKEDEREQSTRNVASFKALAQVQGELIHEARKYGVEVELVSADTWRREVLGVTRPREACKRAAEMKAAELLGNMDGRSEHENEAVLIAWYGAGRIDALEKMEG